MARLAQIPKSHSALVATHDTREHSHADKIRSECQKFVDQFQDLIHEKHRIWFRFKDLEAKSVNQPTSTIDPTTLRSYIPDDVISVLLAASPEDEFTVTNFRYVAKARKAAAFWKVDLQHLLFQIAFDYGKQGEGCFAALCALAQADNNWPRCRTALQACVHDRRQLLLPQTSRRATSLSSRKGVVESDVRAVISRITPPPSSPERPPSQQQVVPEPSPTSTKACQQVVQKPAHELTRITESTPEKGRRDGDRQPPSPILTSSTRSPFHSNPSSPVLPAEGSRSRYKQLEAGDDSVVDVSDLNNLFNYDDLPHDFLVDDSFNPGASDSDNNNPIGDDAQDKTAELFDEGTLYVNAGGTVPNTSAPSYQQAIPTQDKATEEQPKMSHIAKRPRLEDALSGALADAQNIIKEDWWITDQQLMLTLGPMCDTTQSGASGANGAMVVESLETQKMVQPNHVVCRSILCRIPKASLILLPLHLGDNHWALATIRNRRYAAVTMNYFDSLPSDRNLDQARDLILAFVKLYLWETPPRAQVLVPCASPRQANGCDCGVFTFAFALFKATNHELPADLDSRLWRSIMAGCLHRESSSDLSSLVPRPTPNAPTADASISPALPRPQMAKALSQQLKRIQAIQAHDLKRCTSALCNVSLAMQVLDDVASSMTSNVGELEGKLKAAKVLEQGNGLGPKATTNQSKEICYDLPSAMRLTMLVERARGAKERTDGMLLVIRKLRDDTQRAYEELQDNSKEAGEESSIEL